MTAFCSTAPTMQKFGSRAALAFSLALAASHSIAQDVAPDALLKSATSDVTAIIRQSKDITAATTTKVADLVETRVLDLFNFTHMTQIAVGRNWRFATPAQQRTLVAEFQRLLVRTYSASLASDRDRIIEFLPLRLPPGDTEVTVKSLAKHAGLAPITMTYAMEKIATEWKVYDIGIDGISLISAYRETFAGILRDGGLEGLIQSITDQNQQGEVRFRAPRKGDFYSPIFVWGILQGGR